MNNYVKKSRIEVRIFVLFLVFVVIFSVFRNKIADYAAGLLAITHEISIAPAKKNQVASQGQTPVQAQEQQAPIKISTQQNITTKNKVAERINPTVVKKTEVSNNPVLVNLPKTDIPVINFTNKTPAFSDSGFTLFPPLRKHDGTVWNEEKTEIKISTDGKKLYVMLRLYDKNPGDAITGDPKTRKGKGLWDTDSIELFIMKNNKSEHYCQYLISVSGTAQTMYNKTTDKPNIGKTVNPPRSFEFPRFNAEDFDGGFELEMRIALSNIDIETLSPGDTLLMQIVRNYRGQRAKNSATLQLFPVFIYADSRLGINNHDRRAFQEISVKNNK